ncbi:DUF1642 domain-containing protein [Streptococcus suis]|uniref:DUF1642 domain-containing protein n=1 Tax=Streptococcus suis TaxID=1307 RepID=UPI000698C19B|nr:DUF1642 domain-containing protein [Streptococcus suis]NQI41935.1 DUF1642 domain-containing protein [Streptococcus suis]CYU12888.1 phage protein [Streptococcus suis]
MNKQEAIEVIENSKLKIASNKKVTVKAGEIIRECEQVDYVPLEVVVNAIDQIHEPQKVLVPKFVAEWLKEYQYANTLLKVLNAAEDERKITSAVNDWILDNQERFIRAWLFGYEVEQEKLYTVEIPDPNRPDIATFLYKENGKVFIGTDIFLDEVPNYKWKNEPENQLTKSEIEQDFEWAWQFAKEVE